MYVFSQWNFFPLENISIIPLTIIIIVIIIRPTWVAVSFNEIMAVTDRAQRSIRMIRSCHRPLIDIQSVYLCNKANTIGSASVEALFERWSWRRYAL